MDAGGYSHIQPVVVRDGTPCCPCCNEPMTQVGENEWQCALGLAMTAWLRERLRDAQ
jgi:hypothetical protein